jgi:Putative MetA-pathway of phenol degradation
LAWRAACVGTVVAVGLCVPALAGPPYLSDDPEPTDYKHFEIYNFNNGTVSRDVTGGEGGIDINYGGAPDLQLTATIPAGFELPSGGSAKVGLSNIELAAKYRFLHQDMVGWDVAVFPRVFLPSPSSGVGDNHASFLLPIWVQRDWGGGWTSFGGGGCLLSAEPAQDHCMAGWVVTRKLLPKLQLGLELFYQTADSTGTPASSSLGVGLTYDINKTYHLLAYTRRGIENADRTDRFSWYAALLTTF